MVSQYYLVQKRVSEDDLSYILNTLSEANSILQYNFVNKKLNPKTIEHYYSIFNRIIMEIHIQGLDCLLFNNEVEIDESHLFKTKPSFAAHRSLSLSAVWLFGICERNTKRFIIFPVSSRDETNLLKIIFKFIKIGTTFYSDCFSCYVNNHSFPKKSKLSNYNYIHKYVNHKNEFVSSLFSTTHTNTVENLWKQVKTEIRKQKVSVNYIPAIARFYFLRSKSKEEQISLLIKGLQRNDIKKFEDLVEIINSKF